MRSKILSCSGQDKLIEPAAFSRNEWRCFSSLEPTSSSRARLPSICSRTLCSAPRNHEEVITPEAKDLSAPENSAMAAFHLLVTLQEQMVPLLRKTETGDIFIRVEIYQHTGFKEHRVAANAFGRYPEPVWRVRSVPPALCPKTANRRCCRWFAETNGAAGNHHDWPEDRGFIIESRTDRWHRGLRQLTPSGRQRSARRV